MKQNGFSIVEALIAIALILTIVGVAAAIVNPARASFATRLEAADMQQRLRVAAGSLYKDLVMAGAGPYQSAAKGSLGHFFAPILPYEQSTTVTAGAFKTDAITVMYVPQTMAQTTLAADGPLAVSAEIAVGSGAGCPLGDAACGFRTGMAALLYDPSGDYDIFTITNVQSNLLQIKRTGATLTYTDYKTDTTEVVQLAGITYYLKSDPSTGTYQLMSRDIAASVDVPVVDHVVSLRFAYYGEPQPPRLTKPLTDPAGPWTTYGPAPPSMRQQIPTGGYPSGENCTFAVDLINGVQVPRLEVLDSGAEPDGLVELTSAQLTDGPWCPDPLNPNRWDADLLRIRRIGVTLRVESADASLRGPAGALFMHSGTSKRASTWLPDRQVTFQVSPRNLRR